METCVATRVSSSLCVLAWAAERFSARAQGWRCAPQVSTCSQLEALNGTQALTRWRVVAMNATLAVRPNAALVEVARNETARRVAGATALDVGVTLALNGTSDTSVLPTIFTGIVQAVVRIPGVVVLAEFGRTQSAQRLRSGAFAVCAPLLGTEMVSALHA